MKLHLFTLLTVLCSLCSHAATPARITLQPGKVRQEFQYLRQFFTEKPPAVTGGEGKPVPLEGFPTAFGIHIPVEVMLAQGKEIELYELKLKPRPASEVGVTPSQKSGPEATVEKLCASGKVNVQYEPVFGMSSSGKFQIHPALSTLATGKLELEIMPDSPKQVQEPPKPAAPAPASEAPKTEKPKEGADAKPPDAGGERKLPPVDGPPVHPRLANDSYARSGVPLAEQTWPMPPWGIEKEGLSTGIRVIGDAHIGGEVKVELWVRNSGAKDVKFSQNPRADVGLSVVAKDKDGIEHHADITRFSARPIFHHLLLPPGHAVKAKEFTVKFGAGKNDKLERGWVNLQLTPGAYKLRAKWSDSHALVTHADDWTGELTSGDVDFTVAAADAAK